MAFSLSTSSLPSVSSVSTTSIPNNKVQCWAAVSNVGYTCLVDSLEKYSEANAVISQQKKFETTYLPWGEKTKKKGGYFFEKSANILGSRIGPGCVISGGVEAIKCTISKSSISRGVKIGENSSVSSSIIMSNVSIGINTVIKKCIIGSGTQIGPGCKIVNVLIGSNVIIPAGQEVSDVVLTDVNSP